MTLDRIRCMKCGKPVSNVVNMDNVVIRGWIECPECIEKEIPADVILDELKEWIRANDYYINSQADWDRKKHEIIHPSDRILEKIKELCDRHKEMNQK